MHTDKFEVKFDVIFHVTAPYLDQHIYFFVMGDSLSVCLFCAPRF